MIIAMTDSIVCTNCGSKQNINDSFCGKCGKELFVSLDNPGLEDYDFFKILNSVYAKLNNDEKNPTKLKYRAKEAERVIFTKNKKQYEEAQQYYNHQRIHYGTDTLDKFDLNPLFAQYVTNIFAGYSLRIAEEMKIKPTYNREDRKALRNHIQIFTEHEDKNKYAIFSDDGISQYLELATYSLIWKSSYKKHRLILEKDFDKYMSSILNSALKVYLHIAAKTMSEIYQNTKMSNFYIVEKKDDRVQEVYDNILFGYCLRISIAIFMRYCHGYSDIQFFCKLDHAFDFMKILNHYRGINRHGNLRRGCRYAKRCFFETATNSSYLVMSFF